MLSVIIGILVLKKFSITVVKSGKNVLFFTLGITILCTSIGTLVDFFFLYESKYFHDVLTFNFINWTLAVLLIMLSFAIPLYIWSRNLKITVIIPSIIGILNIIIWIFIILVGDNHEMAKIYYGLIPLAFYLVAIIMLIILTLIKSNEYKKANNLLDK